MTLLGILRRFTRDEAGAITVDWVVLTAGIVGLGAAYGFAVKEPIQSGETYIADTISSANSLLETDTNQ